MVKFKVRHPRRVSSSAFSYGNCIILPLKTWTCRGYANGQLNRQRAQVALSEYKRAITSNIAGVSLAPEAIDIQSDRHLRVSDVDRIPRVRLRGYKRYSQRGHPLIHQQKVGIVPRSRFTVHAVAGVTLVAHAGKLILAGRDAARVGGTQIRIVSARGMRQTREPVAVVALKAASRSSS